MKRLNKTESPIFVVLCVYCFQWGPFRFLLLFYEELQHICDQHSKMTFFLFKQL